MSKKKLTKKAEEQDVTKKTSCFALVLKDFSCAINSINFSHVASFKKGTRICNLNLINKLRDSGLIELYEK